jgi:hypothetical protein
MAPPFMGWVCWVIEFLKSPEGGGELRLVPNGWLRRFRWGPLRQQISEILPYFFPPEYACTDEGTNAFAYETG